MYQAAENRYEKMEYKRSGRSGILLPRMSLGLWQNFGLEKTLEEQKAILFKAFDIGITHFDLANNYGAPAKWLAEENFGKILKSDLGQYRDELFISTKAGFDFWPGPYGNWGSRKYLMASLDSSLKRMVWNMWIFSITTGRIRRLLRKRPLRRSPISCAREKRFMWEYPIIRKRRRRR